MSEAKVTGEIKRARETAFRLLKIRGRSEEELRNGLKQKNISGKIIDNTLEQLKNIRLIDDKRFTKDWIFARLNRPFGLRRISLELHKKGIDPEIIKEGLNQAKINYEEDAIVETLTQRRAAQYTQVDSQKRKKRVFDYLARRGFSLESIQKAIQKI